MGSHTDRVRRVAARQPDRKLDAVRAARLVATFASYCAGASTCSSSAPSCTSPHVPRVLTLVSTFFRSPTPGRERLHLAEAPVHLLQPLAHLRNDSPSRASSVPWSRSSTVTPHLLEAGRVVLLERAQPLFDRLAQRVHAPLVRLRERAEMRGQRIAEPRDRAAHLLAQRAPLAGRLRPPLRHLVAQRPLDLGVAGLDRRQPGLDLRQVRRAPAARAARRGGPAPRAGGRRRGRAGCQASARHRRSPGRWRQGED